MKLNVKRMHADEPILSEGLAAKKIAAFGGIYHLATGKVKSDLTVELRRHALLPIGLAIVCYAAGTCPLWLLADIGQPIRNVRLDPNSGHAQLPHQCPLSARNGHND